jgi:hypothetical protein
LEDDLPLFSAFPIFRRLGVDPLRKGLVREDPRVIKEVVVAVVAHARRLVEFLGLALMVHPMLQVETDGRLYVVAIPNLTVVVVVAAAAAGHLPRLSLLPEAIPWIQGLNLVVPTDLALVVG